jgi:hypothetical protein
MKGPHRLPDFSVVVWIKRNEHFAAVRSELLAAAAAEPYETTEYQGMADFHFATTSMADARKLAEALKVVSQRHEVVLLRIISLVDDVKSSGRMIPGPGFTLRGAVAHGVGDERDRLNGQATTPLHPLTRALLITRRFVQVQFVGPGGIDYINRNSNLS